MATIAISVELNTYTCYEGHTYGILKHAESVGCPYCSDKLKRELVDERNKLYIKINKLENKLKRSIKY